MIRVGDDHPISGLLIRPEHPRACYVLAHGAGAGMDHSFMSAMSGRLQELGIATLRYNFPYMEKGSKRPDVPRVAQAAVRAAAGEAARLFPNVPLFAGGKSFGGRMTSQAQAEAPLEGVRGLVFLGFPLHPANLPSTKRAEHLAAVKVPMLFLQGTRDALAQLPLLEAVVRQLPRARLQLFPDADHSFHRPARSGLTDADAIAELARAAAEWMTECIAESSSANGAGL